GTPSRALTDTDGTTLGKLAATLAGNDGPTADGSGSGGASSATDSANDPKYASVAAATTAPVADDRSALCLLDRGEEAFITRLALLDLAERSVDIQTLTW